MRKLLVFIVLGSFGILAGCSGSGGGSTPVGVPTTVTLAPAAGQALNQGASINISATVTTGSNASTGVNWSLSGPGTLSSSTANPVTYTAPASVSSNTPVAVIATSAANSTSSAYLPLTILPAGATNINQTTITVNGGPAPPYQNGVFTSVNICNPGSDTCTTVNGILVDTGSYGLRILQNAITSLSLPQLTDTNSNPIYNCVAFLDGSYLWGPVSEADLRINGEVAGGALIQVISNSNSGIPGACTNGGTTNENTVGLLGANGILGVGVEPTDCESAGSNFCDGSLGSVAPFYFSCPSGNCPSASATAIPESSQVVNPIVLFNTDNNGDVITMPTETSPLKTLNGTLTFGIGTQSNNPVGSATILTLDTSDSFETSFDGQTLVASFVDSGSNGYFFPNWPGYPICTTNTSFYCPTSAPQLSGINTGTNGATSTVSLTPVDADSVIAANPGDSVFPNLTGPGSSSNPPTACSNTGTGDCTFDFGFPFFYGRTVFTAIDGQSVSSATPPWFAY